MGNNPDYQDVTNIIMAVRDFSNKVMWVQHQTQWEAQMTTQNSMQEKKWIMRRTLTYGILATHPHFPGWIGRYEWDIIGYHRISCLK